MKEKELTKMAKEFAKNIKTTDDLTSLTSMLTKQVIEAALGAEMEEHLGYSQKTNKPINLMLEMVIQRKHSKVPMVKSKLLRHEIEMERLSQS